MGTLRVGPGNNFDYTRRAHENDVENIRAALTEDLLIREAELRARGAQEVALALLDQRISDYATEWPEGVVAAEQLRAELARKGAVSVKFDPTPGGVYTAEIDDRAIGRMLDWDAPITKQPQAVQDLVREQLKARKYLRPNDNGPRQLSSAFKAYANDYGGMAGAANGGLAHQILYEAKVRELTADVQARLDAHAAAFRTPGAVTEWATPEAFNEFVRLTGERFEQEGPAAKALSMQLFELGVPGLKYLDALSRDEKKGTRNIVVWDESIVTLTHKNGKRVTPAERDAYKSELRQDAGGRRGYINVADRQHIKIALLERADLSTFLHESGHFFLEVYSDIVDAVRGQDPATLTTPQQQLLSDYETLLEFLEVDNREAIGRAQHERFAEAFEAYLFKGDAPSLSLRQAFARFRLWLLGVYRSLKAMRVKLSPEVRRVLDRMVASEGAIFEAEQEGKVEPMFLTADAAGMNEEQFALYRSAVADASRTTREKLESRLMAEIQREQQDDWKARRRAIEQVVTQDAEQMPVYQAIAAMQTGRKPNGEPLLEGLEDNPLKLSRQILVERFGLDRLRTLPRPYIYRSEGGADPDVVAEMFEFSSADELLTAVAAAVPMRRWIQQETDRRMLAEHGSLLLDGTLHEAARTAISNEDREVVIRAELRALGQLRRMAKPFVQAGEQALAAERAERAYERRWLEAERKLAIALERGQAQARIDELRAEVRHLRQKARGGAATIRAAIPPDSAIRALAQQRIAGTKIRALKPQVFWSASRKAAQLAMDATARQDFEGAIALKQQELLNLALYREASEAKLEVDRRVRKARDLQRLPARQRLGKAGESYLDQVDAILERFSLAAVSQRALNRRSTLAAWVAAQEAEGLPIDLPDDVLEEARRVPYQDLTVEGFTGVMDGLDQIVHLARLKNRLLTAQKARELAEVVDSVTDSIRASKPNSRRARTRRDRRPSGEKTRIIDAVFAGHRKIASLVREMDSFVDGGPVWEYLIRPLNAAGDREAIMNAAASKALVTLANEAFPGRAKANLYTDLYIPAIGRSLSRMERIMLGLNWGTETNRQRIRTSEKWTDQQVQAVIDTLDPSDWTFIEGVWTLVNSYWAETEAKQKRVYGVAPSKVEGIEVRTRFGSKRGQYFPLKYDERLSAKAGAFADLESGIAAKQAAYVNATTKRGHTKERQSRVNLPVRYDFGVITEHLQQVIHDLTHHEALLDVERVLRARSVQEAIYDRYGDAVYTQFKTALRDIAQGQMPATNGFEKVINHLRIGSTIAALGWSITTAALQPIGLTQSMVRIGPSWVARGMSRWLRDAAHMENTVAWIVEKSQFMKVRGLTQQREINEIRNTIGINTGRIGGWVDEVLRTVTFNTVHRQAIADSYFFLIQQLQRVADVPTWLGEYEKQMAAGKDEGTAIALADQAVLDSQAGGQIKDLAAVQRGGPMLKLWTNFYSFFSTTHNQLVEQTHKTRFRNPAAVGRLAVNYLLLLTIPAVLGRVLVDAIKGDLPDDAEELAELLVKEQAAYLAGTMLGLREISGAIQGFTGYEGPAGARAFAALSRFGLQAAQGEFDAAFWRSLNDASGMLFHYPATQVRRTIEGMAALADGKSENPAVLLGGPSREAR